MSGYQCPICLGPVSGESYLDRCFHKFCYHCILQWTDTVSSCLSTPLTHLECPLCKTQNASIIHDFKEHTFQRQYFSKPNEICFSLSEHHLQRLKVYLEPPGVHMKDVNCKTHNYLRNNLQVRLWIERELQALLQVEDVNIITLHILGILESLQRRHPRSIRRCSSDELEARHAEFISVISDAARPFLFERSSRFAFELEGFILSGLNVAAYDELIKQRSTMLDELSDDALDHSKNNDVDCIAKDTNLIAKST